MRNKDCNRNASNDEALIKLINKSQHAINEGQLWRAKEIVRSSFNRFGINPVLNAHYGKILLAMKDDMQAGKYLFFGEPNPNEDEVRAINLFTNRHGHNEEYGLLTAAPLRFDTKASDYPEFINARLAKFHNIDLHKPNKTQKVSEKSDFGCLLIFIFMLVSMVIGIGTILSWTISIFN